MRGALLHRVHEAARQQCLQASVVMQGLRPQNWSALITRLLSCSQGGVAAAAHTERPQSGAHQDGGGAFGSLLPQQQPCRQRRRRQRGRQRHQRGWHKHGDEQGQAAQVSSELDVAAHLFARLPDCAQYVCILQALPCVLLLI